MKLGDIVSRFLAEERSIAVLLPETQVEALAIAATVYYCGYNNLVSHPNTELEDITPDAQIGIAEWVVIKPLFLLYVERETALQTEATGMQGVNGYGRNSSEVNSDIARLEESFSTTASTQGVITIGGDYAAGLDDLNDVYPYGFKTF